MKPYYTATTTVPAPAGHSLLTAVLDKNDQPKELLRAPVLAYVVAVVPDDACVNALPARVCTYPVVPQYGGEQVVAEWADDWPSAQPRAIERGTEGDVVGRGGVVYANAEAWLSALKPQPKQKRGCK